MNAINPDAKIMKYTDLYDYDSIEELFKDCDKIILLFLTISKRAGHWTCLYKQPNSTTINYYDSYGVMPDYELQAISKKRRAELNESYDYLRHLLMGHNVNVNRIQFQNDKSASCGCFVSHRLFYSHLSPEQYLKLFFDSKATPDVYVAKWCFTKLNKIM